MEEMAKWVLREKRREAELKKERTQELHLSILTDESGHRIYSQSANGIYRYFIFQNQSSFRNNGILKGVYGLVSHCFV